MKAAEKAVRDILCISDEYEQTLFNYRERGGDRPKGMEYFKREVEVVKQYAAEVSRELQEPIENALYATGKFTTDECMELTEGIIQYVKEQEEQQ